MKVVTILGSASAYSNTKKALSVVENKFTDLGAEVSQLDPLDLKLNNPATTETEDTKRITQLVRDADIVILATGHLVWKALLASLAAPRRRARPSWIYSRTPCGTGACVQLRQICTW